MTTVLVVEDERDLRELVTMLLSIEGYDVIAVERAEDAVDRVNDADIILLDIRLPGMSGIEFVQLLPEADRARVLLMSAHAGIKYRTLADEHGCAGFLTKPFQIDDLYGLIAALVAN